MIAVAAALALQAATSKPPVAMIAPPVVVPTDWRTLAPLPWRSEPYVSADLSGFVVQEIRSNRCGAAAPRGDTLTVEVAVRLRADGRVGSVIPRAIDCPTVEQFAAGLVTSFARNNLRTAPEGWYRTAITFAVGP